MEQPEYFGDRPNAGASLFFSNGPVVAAGQRSGKSRAMAMRLAQQYTDVAMVESVKELQDMSNDAHLSTCRLCLEGDEAVCIPGQLKLILRYLGNPENAHVPPPPAGALVEREAAGGTASMKPEWQGQRGKGGESNLQNFTDCNRHGQVHKSTLPLPLQVKERMKLRIKKLQRAEGTEELGVFAVHTPAPFPRPTSVARHQRGGHSQHTDACVSARDCADALRR